MEGQNNNFAPPELLPAPGTVHIVEPGVGKGWRCTPIRQVKTTAVSDTGLKRQIRIGFFEIKETDPKTKKTVVVCWIFGIGISDENGTELASAGQTNTQAESQV